jgi:hypothetical protein
MENRRKNDADNKRYEEGYGDGRDGSDPLQDIVGGILGLRNDPVYKAGRKKGREDSQAYDRRENKQKRSAESTEPKRNKKNERREESYSGYYNSVPIKTRPVSHTILIILALQIFGSFLVYSIGPSINQILDQPDQGLPMFLAWAAYTILRIPVMIFLLPGTVFLWLLFPDFIGSALSNMS